MGRAIDRANHPKLDEWLSAIEGTKTPQAADGSDVQCDFCREPIEPNSPVTNYVADPLVNDEFIDHEFNGLHFLRVYCAECDRRELKQPCREYTELLLAGYVDEQKRLQDLSIEDASPPSRGTPYDPVEVWKVTHPDATWEEFNRASARFSRTGQPVAMGPGDIIDDLLYHDVSPEDVFTAAGDIIADEDAIHEQIRESSSD